MRILAFQGSPRADGNTAALFAEVVKAAREAGADVTEIMLHGKKIAPCTSCYACKAPGASGCVIRDDMDAICEGVMGADAFLFATPIYWWSVSAQMKLLWDRFFALDYERAMKGKRAALVMTYGGALPNLGPEGTEAAFRDICLYLAMDCVGVVGACTETVSASRNESAMNAARELGRMLTASHP
jgi:multimeric flavodoxin WrbA